MDTRLPRTLQELPRPQLTMGRTEQGKEEAMINSEQPSITTHLNFYDSYLKLVREAVPTLQTYWLWDWTVEWISYIYSPPSRSLKGHAGEVSRVPESADETTVRGLRFHNSASAALSDGETSKAVMTDDVAAYDESQIQDPVAGDVAVACNVAEVITKAHTSDMHSQPMYQPTPDHSNRPLSLNNLSTAMIFLFSQLDTIEDLGKVISHDRPTVGERSLIDALCVASPRSLVNSYVDQLQHLPGTANTSKQYNIQNEGSSSHSIDNSSRFIFLSDRARSAFTRFQQTGRIEDLEDSISRQRGALSLCPLDHPDHATCLSNLAATICIRFQQLGRLEDMEEAMACNRKALRLRPSDHPHRFDTLNNLANAATMRFEELGIINDLNEAIAFHRNAYAILSPDHPGRPITLSNLACSIAIRSEMLGKPEDIKKAITYHRKALGAYPIKHPLRTKILNNLANALCIRFQQLGRFEDIEEAILHHRQVLHLRPPGHPERSDSLSNLAAANLIRYQKQGDIEDLEEAITCHRQALDFRFVGHRRRSATLHNLALASYARFGQRGQPMDLEEAISCHHEALNIVSFDRPTLDTQSASIKSPRSTAISPCAAAGDEVTCTLLQRMSDLLA